MSSIVVAIDGPAGAGKGTLARRLAHIYNLAHLDTGLLYRAVGLKMLQKGADLTDHVAAVEVALSLKEMDFKSPKLRDEGVGLAASHVAAVGEVRKVLLSFQRQFATTPSAGKQGVILDGRDIGRIVLPHALVKFFVTASPEVRAMRRLKELQEKEISCIYDEILQDIKARDSRDQTRKISPLLAAEDAYILDTSELGIDEVVKKACIYMDLRYPNACKYSE